MNVRKLWPYALVVLPWCAYVAITFLAPDTGVRLYGLSPQQLFFARLGSLLFVLTYWFAGCYCVVTSFHAARDVPEKKKAFRHIGIGALSLLVGNMVGTNTVNAKSFFIDDPAAFAALGILTNYALAISAVIGAYFLFSGSGLLSSGKARVGIWRGWKVAGYAALAYVSGAYLWLVFGNPDRQAGMRLPYYLPDSVIAATIVLPYLAAYALATFTSYRGTEYFLSSGGAAHKVAARQFSSGVLCLVFGTIILQAIITLGPTRSASIGAIGSIALISGFLIVQLIANLLLASGLRKISGIERLTHEYGSGADDSKPLSLSDPAGSGTLLPPSLSYAPKRPLS